MKKIKSIFLRPILQENLVTVQLLGLCPTLAVSSNLIYAICLGIATTLVITATNLSISITSPFIPHNIRIPCYILIISSVVTILEIIIHTYSLSLYEKMGIFLPLIVTNCGLLAKAHTAAKQKSLIASIEGFATGIGLTFSLACLGIVREFTGQGTLFNNARVLLGNFAKSIELTATSFDNPFLIMILPPGAFIVLGCIMALKRTVSHHLKNYFNKKKAIPVFVKYVDKS